MSRFYCEFCPANGEPCIVCNAHEIAERSLSAPVARPVQLPDVRCFKHITALHRMGTTVLSRTINGQVHTIIVRGLHATRFGAYMACERAVRENPDNVRIRVRRLKVK